MNSKRKALLWLSILLLITIGFLAFLSFAVQPKDNQNTLYILGQIVLGAAAFIEMVVTVLTGAGILPLNQKTDWDETPILPISIQELQKRRGPISYVDRGNLEKDNLFSTHRIAIIGEQGIGKSRETIEFLLKGIRDQNFGEERVFELFNLKAFDEKSLEHLLLKHHHKDCNLALLIDNFHSLCVENDLEKLEKLLVTLGSGKALYIFLSARIDLITQKQREWLNQENNFKTIILHGFDLEAFNEYVTHLEESKGMVLESGVEEFILKTTGGIPELIHIGIRSLAKIESKQINMKIAGEVIPKRLKDAWSGYYSDICRKHPQTKYLIQTLSAFQAAEMPYFTALVIQYSKNLWKSDANAKSKYQRGKLKQALDHLTNFGLQYDERRIWPRDYMVEEEPHKEECVERLGQYLLNTRKGRTRKFSLVQGSDLYADAFWVLGDYYRIKEEWNCAINYYSASINEKETPSTYNNRGLTYYKMVKYKEALLDYREALRLDPKKVEAYVNRGLMFHDMEKYKEALADYREALRLDPTNAEIYFNRGFTYHNIGEYREALADYGESLRLDRKKVGAYVNRGMIYNEIEKYDEALTDFEEALRLDPTNAEIYFHRGLTYHYMEEYEEALADYSEALRLDPKKVEAYVNRGITHAKMSEYYESLADYDDALKLDEKKVDVYVNRGFTYHYMGEYSEALADYDEALRLDPKKVDAYVNRGLTYNEIEKFDEALTDFEEALRLDPTNARTHYFIGRLFKL